MSKKKEKLTRVPWIILSQKFLKSIADTPFEKCVKEIKREIEQNTGKSASDLRISPQNLDKVFSNMKIKRRRNNLLVDKLSVAEKEEFKKRYPEEAGFTTKQIDEAVKGSFPNGLNPYQRLYIASALGLKGRRTNLRGAASEQGRRSVEEKNTKNENFSQIEKSIENKLDKLIKSNILVEQGEDKLYEVITKEFAEEISQLNFQFPKEKYLPLLDRLVWTAGPNGSLTLLDEMVSKNLSNEFITEKFHQYNKHIPLRMVEDKSKWLRGITNKLVSQNSSGSPTLPGVNRFIGDEGLEGGEDFEFSSTTFSAPHLIPITSKNWNILIINGANIGLEHDPRIEKNVVWQALNEAERRKVDAVFIVNTIDINTKKAAGPSRVVEAFFSGIDVNPDVLDPDYLERVKDVLKNNPKDKVLHITRQEILKDVILGWQKILLGPDDPIKPTKVVPAYSGPIYIVFGIREAQLVSAAAYWEIHRINLNQQTEVRTELGLVEKAYRNAFDSLKALEQKRIEYAAKYQSDLTDKQAKKALDEVNKKVEMLSKEAAELKSKAGELNSLKSRTIMTNVADQDLKRFHKMALAHMVKLFETIGRKKDSKIPTIPPNCKVVGMGDTYFQIGKEKLGINIPGHLRITDSLLADFNNKYGPKVIRCEMPDLTVISHPYAINQRGGAREVDAKGKRGSAQIAVAPTCVDDKFLRSKLRNIIEKGKHPIGRTVFAEQSATGVLLASCTDGVISTDSILLSALDVRKIRKRTKSKSTPDKYIWVEIDTDVHIGNRNREFLFLKSRGIRYGVSELVFQMFRDTKYMPLHIFSMNDDPLHGDHFGQHRQPHHQEMPYGLIQEELNRLYEEAERTLSKHSRKEFMDEARHIALQQLSLRGIPWYNDQIEAFLEEFLEPNADIFSGILQNVVKSNLIFRGVSELIPDVRTDKRDIGAIGIGTGNHGIKTVLGNFAEGRILRLFLMLLMRSFPEWKDKKDFLKKHIKAPLYGNVPVAYGTVQAPGGYEWGLDFRGTPPSGSTNWADPLMNAVRVGQRRGNPSRILDGKMSLITHGDKHFESYVMTNYGIYIMAPPDTPTDSFAEWAGGFPPNNTGVLFVGLPAEGPESGPILIRPLLFDHIKRFLDNNEKFDLEKYLPNPV